MLKAVFALGVVQELVALEPRLDGFSESVAEALRLRLRLLELLDGSEPPAPWALAIVLDLRGRHVDALLQGRPYVWPEEIGVSLGAVGRVVYSPTYLVSSGAVAQGPPRGWELPFCRLLFAA